MCAVCVWVCVCVIYTACVYVIYIYCEFKYGIRVMYTVYVWVYTVSVVSLWCTQCMYVSGSVAYMIYTVCINVSVLFGWCTVCECKCGVHTMYEYKCGDYGMYTVCVCYMCYVYSHVWDPSWVDVCMRMHVCTCTCVCFSDCFSMFHLNAWFT